MSRWLAMVALVVVVGAFREYKCVCNPGDCEVLGPSGCPGLGMVVFDTCRCCLVCARVEGEHCGDFKGTCESGLICKSGICVTFKNETDFEDVIPETVILNENV